MVEIAVLVGSFQHLRQLVVGHGGGGVHLAFEQQVHVERLLDQLHAGVFVDAILCERRQQLELVAAKPDGYIFAGQVGGAGDAGVLPRDFTHGRAFKDLGHVDQFSALFAAPRAGWARS